MTLPPRLELPPRVPNQQTAEIIVADYLGDKKTLDPEVKDLVIQEIRNPFVLLAAQKHARAYEQMMDARDKATEGLEKKLNMNGVLTIDNDGKKVTAVTFIPANAPMWQPIDLNEQLVQEYISTEKRRMLHENDIEDLLEETIKDRNLPVELHNKFIQEASHAIQKITAEGHMEEYVTPAKAFRKPKENDGASLPQTVKDQVAQLDKVELNRTNAHLPNEGSSKTLAV